MKTTPEEIAALKADYDRAQKITARAIDAVAEAKMFLEEAEVSLESAELAEDEAHHAWLDALRKVQ